MRTTSLLALVVCLQCHIAGIVAGKSYFSSIYLSVCHSMTDHVILEHRNVS